MLQQIEFQLLLTVNCINILVLKRNQARYGLSKIVKLEMEDIL